MKRTLLSWSRERGSRQSRAVKPKQVTQITLRDASRALGLQPGKLASSLCRRLQCLIVSLGHDTGGAAKIRTSAGRGNNSFFRGFNPGCFIVCIYTDLIPFGYFCTQLHAYTSI